MLKWGINRKWKKGEWYFIYWTCYLVIFTIVQGLTDRDFFTVFRNELLSLIPKMLFVWIIAERLMDQLLFNKKTTVFIIVYLLLMLGFAVILRLIDNYIILRYYLVYWKKEPLLSVAPFLYNIIKLQFLLTIPFCRKLYIHLNAEKEQRKWLREDGQRNDENGALTATENQAFLYLKCERRMVKILFSDIYYFEAQGNYLLTFTINGTFKSYLSVSELEDKLPADSFVRIHRSFIVALNRIDSHNSSFVMVGDKKIPIGRSYGVKVKDNLAYCR